MSIRRTLATAKRVLQQLQHDPRTIALIMGVPVLLMTLLKFVFEEQSHIFATIAPILLGIFPLFVMFLVTSIATLRERTSGTLDRFMTQPISKLDFVFGYATAFSLVGLNQAIVVSFVTLQFLDVSVAGEQFRCSSPRSSPLFREPHSDCLSAPLLGTSFRPSNSSCRYLCRKCSCADCLSRATKWQAF